jgi:heme exporter protein A
VAAGVTGAPGPTSGGSPGVGPAAALQAEGLAHFYAGGRGLAPLGFALAGPGVAAITGPNGSGKSTLLRLLAGLLRPTSGRVRLLHAGRDVPAGERRALVGYAAPDLAFYEELSCRENLVFAAAARGLRDGEARSAAALDRVGLSAGALDRVAALSSGMRQRLRLAFATLHRPPLLLLDEPGIHLDDEGRGVMERIVREESAAGLVVIATNEAREWGLAERRIELRGHGLGHPA